ncbi:MAG: serine/threonine protein kinase [Deltaproteobacteria bacterium]|nr:serine/threonine protein kinase [Deltaproteobacteria bacterium]
MAEAHLARMEAPGGASKLCVLKTIRPELAADSAFREAFFDEARLALSLDHGAIVHTFDFGEEAGRLYLAMEWCDAGDLEGLMHALAVRGERIPIPIACTILARVLEGLRYAHDARDALGRPLDLVHRDISPSNVLLTFSGEAKLGDFGISRAALRRGATGAGLVKGKPPYLSPEQARGETATVRSDIFACGVLLWEILVGGRLFDGGDTRQILAKVAAARVPRPDLHRPDLPMRLAAIVLRALRSDPTDRFPSAEDFYREILEFARESGFALDAATLSTFLRERLVDQAGENVRARVTTPVMASEIGDQARIGARDKRDWRWRDLAIATAGAAVSLVLAWVLLSGGALSRRNAKIETVPPPISQVRPGPGATAFNLDADPPGTLVVVGDRPIGFTPVRAAVAVEKRAKLPVRTTFPGRVAVGVNMIFEPGTEKTAKRVKVGLSGVVAGGFDVPSRWGAVDVPAGASLRLPPGLFRVEKNGVVTYERIGPPVSAE